MLSTDRGGATGHKSRSVVKGPLFAKVDQSNQFLIQPDFIDDLVMKKSNRLHFKQIHMNSDKEVRIDSVLTNKFPATRFNNPVIQSKRLSEAISFSKYKQLKKYNDSLMKIQQEMHQAMKDGSA